jgi:hypothetical protein
MFTPIQLDKTRNLRYGMKAVSLIEKKMDTSIGKVDFSNITMEQIAIILWAGLVHEDDNLTPDIIMDLVDEYSSVPKVTDIMNQALTDAFGAQEKN